MRKVTLENDAKVDSSKERLEVIMYRNRSEREKVSLTASSKLIPARTAIASSAGQSRDEARRNS